MKEWQKELNRVIDEETNTIDFAKRELERAESEIKTAEIGSEKLTYHNEYYIKMKFGKELHEEFLVKLLGIRKRVGE